jgi:DNA modification methylase
MQEMIDKGVKVDLTITSPLYDNHRRFIGIEIVKNYYEIAQYRIEKAAI